LFCFVSLIYYLFLIESFITGDRFSEEFTEKRRNLLEIYMKRIARHPEIQNSDILKNFLENTDMVNYFDILNYLTIIKKKKKSISINIYNLIVNINTILYYYNYYLLIIFM